MHHHPPTPSDLPLSTSGSESEPTSSRLFPEKGRTAEDSSQAARDGTREVASAGQPDRVTFQGQYTGGPGGGAGWVPSRVVSVLRSLFHFARGLLSSSMSFVIQNH